MNYKVFSFWLILIVIWNFGWPFVHPIWDVLVAIILTFVSKYIGDYLKKKESIK